ncbi:MAG: hypothetical protein GTN71_09170 [Anaerolineae bacterium]|nr:hypothetical protein [Anaerolineae bacterium]
MVKVTVVAVPEEGVAPVPVQPVQTCLVPVLGETGDVTEEETVDPGLYHPSPVGLPKGELTVR